MIQPDLGRSIDDFLSYILDIRGYSPRTVDTYQIALEQMVLRCSMHRRDDRWILDIMPYRVYIRTLSKRTIHARLTAIRSFVRYLQEQVAIDITLVGADTIRTPQTLPKPIAESSIVEVLANATATQELLVAILYGLGLRISEAAHLRLSSISNDWIEIHGKGNKVRQLPVLPYLRGLIATHIDTTHPRRFLFEKNGDPLNPAQLRYIVTKLFRSHGLKATPHQLRHSFATHLLAHGARISDVSELLGHSSMATTQVYTQLSTVKKLDEYRHAHPLMQSANN